MRIFNKFRGTKGFISGWERLLRFRYMISEEAKERCRILAFWERHGTDATQEAFRVSRRTLFRWQAALYKAGGKLEALNLCSRAPRKRRRRNIPLALEKQIIEMRRTHPRLGKDKVHALLARTGYQGSISTVGRLLGDLRKTGQLPHPIRVSLSGRTGRLIERKPLPHRKKLRRPKGYRVLEVDTVIRFIDGVKRYVLTAVDTDKRQALAAAYTNHGSASAADFLMKCLQVLPDCPNAVQTDNGSEFALHFSKAAGELGLTHFHTYPRSPKMNAHVERFNRTLDEEFLRYKKALLRDDVRAFNNKLVDWLLWYNTERPHSALGQVSPFRYMMRSLPVAECQMWWTDTISGTIFFMVS